MNEMVNTQMLLFLTSIQIGIILAILYDFVRIFRKAIPHLNWMIQLEDILYWIFSTAIGFGILYVHNYGEIRLFVFGGMLLGAILYLLTFSIILMKVATYIIEQVKKVVTWIVKIISIPIRWIIAVLLVPLRLFKKSMDDVSVYGRRKHKQMKKSRYYNQADRRVEKRIKKDIGSSK